MSHRIIEKRRRDRMNQCLADLSQLIPPAYLKQVNEKSAVKVQEKVILTCVRILLNDICWIPELM